MVRIRRTMLVVAAVQALLAGGEAHGQTLPPAPANAAVEPSASCVPEDHPLPYVLPPMGQPPELPDPAAHAAGSPLLDRPGTPCPGLFANVEVDVVDVQLRNQLINTVPISSTRTGTVQFDGVRLGWTGQPRFELGYRLCDGLGDLQVGYSFLDTSGTDRVAPDAASMAPAFHKGRLDEQLLDFDYVSREYSLAPCWEMRWIIGLRLESVYFDNQIQAANDQDTFAGGLAAERTTSHFQGLGPRAGLELTHCFADCGLALFVRVEGASLYGRIRQTFEEDLSVPSPDNPGAIGFTAADRSLTTPWVKGQCGVSYTLPGWNYSRVVLGYEYDHSWLIGRLDDSRGDITVNGLFLRGEFNF